jgi:DNA-directed RNA polymerase specialized sigma24 family protein
LERLGTSRVPAALWALPEVQRIAITLMDLCGFTAAQAAAITGVGFPSHPAGRPGS